VLLNADCTACRRVVPVIGEELRGRLPPRAEFSSFQEVHISFNPKHQF